MKLVLRLTVYCALFTLMVKLAVGNNALNGLYFYPAPVREPAKAEAAPAAAPAPAVDNSEVLSALKELTKTIQKNAILRDDLKLVKPDTAEDILGKIINPTGQ